MTSDIVLADFDECKAQIEKDFGVRLDTNDQHRTLLLRGENAPYPKTQSSMKRFLTAEDGTTMKPLYYVSPFIDFEDIYAGFHSEVHDLSKEAGVGFLQHYGLPTDLFDFSPSVDNTRFFATHGYESESIALIGVFPRTGLESHFTLTDLSNHPVAQRPRRQLAYVGRPPRGIVDLKDARCTALLQSKWYRFRKTPADLDFAKSHAAYAYPSEEELAYFFGEHVMDFFRHHWTSKNGDMRQRHLVEEKLTLIRNQLK